MTMTTKTAEERLAHILELRHKAQRKYRAKKGQAYFTQKQRERRARLKKAKEEAKIEAEEKPTTPDKTQIEPDSLT
ncbi:MAG: hypothetical protein Salg2KO_10240 [Salibacteraceae bacterium]